MTPTADDPRPWVGVGVIIVREGRVLLGRRLGAHGAGTWALPGGHLEHGEDVDDCARREAREETGLHLGDITAGPYVSHVFEDSGRHYVTLFVVASSADGEPERREPAKCEGWEWHGWSALPQPLFAPLRTLFATGYRPPLIDRRAEAP